ncbi:MAG: VWA domain-containing protein [Gammaproteobacteria bacterium]|nr:VWA domain-containing protein [Gammaproteobacteria bacterium]MDH5736423.1 VWA domain-containing protein [Gammaproteobacteria bacterium]
MKYFTGILVGLILVLTGCSDPKPQTKAVYMLLDTSGTYTQQLDKAKNIIKYLLGNLNSGDSFAVARIDSESFSEKDLIAKITFDMRPSKANAEKRTFNDIIDKFTSTVKGSAYTDITGGMLQAIEYLNETGAGYKYILIFSDLKEEVKKGHVRDFPITLTDIKVTALNVTKLQSDNIDPREYMTRVEQWTQRVEDGGGTWRVINDLDRLEGLLD